MLSPVLVGLAVFAIGPIIYSFVLSFMDYNIMLPPVFTGLANIRKAMGDRLLHQSLGNTIYFAFVGIPLSIAVSMILALMLNTKIRFKSMFRTFYFLPVVTSMVAVSTVWFWLYNREFGLINYLLWRFFSIEGPGWLSDPKYAMNAIIIMSVWKGAGYNMVIFLAALQGVPKELYESATIDGAGPVRQFIRITLPMISTALFFVLIMSVIGSFQVFEQTYVLTRGGPRYATSTIVLLIFNEAFMFYRMGYASLMAWILFIIISGFTALQMVFQRKWVFTQ